MNALEPTDLSRAPRRHLDYPLALPGAGAILRHRYFLGSLALYTLLLLIVRNREITTYISTGAGLFKPDQVLIMPLPRPKPPEPVINPLPIRPDQPAGGAVSPSIVKQPAGKPIVLRPDSVSTPPMSPPLPAPRPDLMTMIRPPDVLLNIREAEKARLTSIARNHAADWQIVDHPNRKMIKVRFTIFQAKYQDGDWNCNPDALKNLLLQIRAWSRNRIDANLFPEILDIGTDKLFTLKPPFVYLTGHKDFHFLDSEVKNLRDYLMLGGAIWADTALAGRRSRFDHAFRREMGKVLPDRAFEPVPTTHPLFTTDAFFPNRGLPSGMNHYEEPMEMISIGRELAVLYSLNGYGHFWESRLNRDGRIEWGLVSLGTNRFGQAVWAHVTGPHLASPRWITGTLYRNVNDDSVRNAYQLGINAVTHLVLRYQKYTLPSPRELPAPARPGLERIPEGAAHRPTADARPTFPSR